MLDRTKEIIKITVKNEPIQRYMVRIKNNKENGYSESRKNKRYHQRLSCMYLINLYIFIIVTYIYIYILSLF